MSQNVLIPKSSISTRQESSQESGREPTARQWRNRWLLSLLFLLPFLFLKVIGDVGECCVTDPEKKAPPLFIQNLLYNTLFLREWGLQLAIATPVQFGLGLLLYKQVGKKIKQKQLDISLLLVASSFVLYGYSLYYSLFGGESLLGFKTLYYGEAVAILSGAFLLQYIVKRAGVTPSRISNTFVPLAALTSITVFVIWYEVIQDQFFFQKALLHGVATALVLNSYVWTLVAPAADLYEPDATRAIKIARKNQIWAYFYTIVTLVFAASGQISPLLAIGLSILGISITLLNSYLLARKP